jgi:hypothetical protein
MFLIVLMMEAMNNSETSVNSYETTRRNIPEDSHLHTRRRENLKSFWFYLATGKSQAFYTLVINYLKNSNGFTRDSNVLTDSMDFV